MDERRHPPGPGRDWEESWSFDFVSAPRSGGRSGPSDGAFGGFVRLALRPGDHRAWYWAYLARPGRPLVVVRDHDVELPRSRELEVRGDGLWAQVICETPFDHWSAGLEASAVAIDDPVRAWGDERGDPVALGLDLEWEMQGQPGLLGDAGGYLQPAAVHGEVLLGAERLAVDGTGWYTHAWGPPAWRGGRWWEVRTHPGDATATAARASGQAWTWPVAGPSPPTPGVGPVALETAWGPDGLPTSANLAVGDPSGAGVSLPVHPRALAPVPLEVAGGRDGVLVRALCGFGPAVADEEGWGWAEWRQPTGPTSP